MGDGLTETNRGSTGDLAVKPADETGWRTDGHSGYAWLFCTPALSIFAFRETRWGESSRTDPGRQKSSRAF